MRRSPPRYSAAVQNTLKVAHARAALGYPVGAEQGLEAAMELVARMDQTEQPENHFVFDAPKFDKFASEVYAEAGMATRAAYHARISIARSDHPDDRARHHPMRASAARVALASALADMDELEEACSVASEALQGALSDRGGPRPGRGPSSPPRGAARPSAGCASAGRRIPGRTEHPASRRIPVDAGTAGRAPAGLDPGVPIAAADRRRFRAKSEWSGRLRDWDGEEANQR